MREANHTTSLEYTFNKSRYILSVLEKWTPEKSRSRSDLLSSLYDHLHNHLPENAVLAMEPVSGPVEADILIDSEVALWIIPDLNTPQHLKRFMEQLQKLKTWEGSLIFILTGQTDPGLKEEFQTQLKQMNNSMFPRFFIVEK